MNLESLRVAIVAPDASAKFGGEAILPLHYFRHLRERGVQVWMVLHSRTRKELTEILGDDIDRVSFVEDTVVDITLFRLSQLVPAKIGSATFGVLLRLYTQIRQKKLLKQIVKDHQIQVVHEPAPVSPKTPSLIYGVGAPVIIGPMNGGMTFPPPFKDMERLVERVFVTVARRLSYIANCMIPGKRKAAMLLVANQRTAEALAVNCRKQNIVTLVENGVDLRVFSDQSVGLGSEGADSADRGLVKLLFIGRLVDWKAVDILLDIFASIDGMNLELHILGDGKERRTLELQAKSLGIQERVIFHGFLPQKQCAEVVTECQIIVLPSLYECGGAVVLEAMAMGKPVIATDWGGPSDYLNEKCGILVDPTKSVDAFKEGFRSAIIKLASEPKLCQQLGKEGQKRIHSEFSWDKKIDAIISLYGEVQK